MGLNKKNYMLLVDGLYEGGRMFVGGISVAFMLSRGLAAESVALVKMAQAAVFFALDVPSGLLADKIGRKIALLIATLCGITGFVTYLNGHGLTDFLLGEIFLAASLSFWSGAYEAFSIEIAKLDSAGNSVRIFFHTNEMVNQVSIVLAGALAGFAIGRQNNFALAYILAIAAMLAVMILILLLPNDHPHRVKAKASDSDFMSLLKSSFLTVWQNESIRTSTIVMVFLQFLVQPVLHYWQPFSEVALSITPQQLSLLFSVFCFASAMLNYLLRGTKKIPLGLSLGIWVLAILLVGLSSYPALTIAAMIFVQASYSYIKAQTFAEIAFHAPGQERAGVMSAAGLFSRFGMVGGLGSVGLLINTPIVRAGGNIYSNIYTVFGVIGILGVILITLRSRRELKICKPVELSKV